MKTSLYRHETSDDRCRIGIQPHIRHVEKTGKCRPSRDKCRESFAVTTPLDFMQIVCRLMFTMMLKADSAKQGLTPSEQADELFVADFGRQLLQADVRKRLASYFSIGPDLGHQRKFIASLRSRLNLRRAVTFSVISADHGRSYLNQKGLHGDNASLSTRKLKDLLRVSGISLTERPAELGLELAFICRLVFLAPKFAPIWSEVAGKPQLGSEAEKIELSSAVLLYLLLEPSRLKLFLAAAEQYGGDLRYAVADAAFAEMLTCIADRHNLLVKADGLEEMFGLLDIDNHLATLQCVCAVVHHVEHFWWLTEIYHRFAPDRDELLMVCPDAIDEVVMDATKDELADSI